MNESNQREHRVRQFLLGQLGEYERQQFEENLMRSTADQEHVLIIEEGLIEDYLDGVLQANERQAFETHFLASIQQRRRLQIARLLGSFGSTEIFNSNQSHPPAPAAPRRWSIARGIRNHPVVLTSLAAVLLLVIATVILQGIRSQREDNQHLEATKQRLLVERELAQLNSAHNVTASTLSLVLAPITPRYANNASTLSMPFPAEIVEVRLILSGPAYSHYAVELSRIGAAERFTINELHSQATAEGLVVIVKLPSRMLGPGDYRLLLSGITDGNQTTAGEYNFQVSS